MVIAIIAVLVGILLPALSSARKSARTLVCQANLRQMGTAAIGYGGANREVIPAFNWKPGNYRTSYADLRNPPDGFQAIKYQAVEIVRDWTGNQYIPRSMGSSTNWFANLWFSHLIFRDYLSTNLEEPVAACPEDAEQVERAETPSQEYTTSQLYRKFESSYETAITTYSVDQARNGVNPVEQDGDHYNIFNRDPDFLVSRRFTQVAFPSSKVYMFDHIDRHYAQAPDTLFFEPGARQPILFFDSSVSVRDTNDANPGFQPLNPTSAEPSKIRKVFNGSEFFDGVYRWTRGGLVGIDFGGSEINTGQPIP